VYCYAVIGSAVAAGKNHLSLFNGIGSGKVIRVWRVEVVNHQAAAVTGLSASFVLARTTTTGNGTAAVLRKADPGEDDPPAQITAKHAHTAQPSVAANSELGEVTLSTEETSAQTAKQPVFEAAWDRGVSPVTLREGGGVVVQQVGLAGAGQVSVFIWFTF
jgi:hypothetical protein